MKRFSFLFIFLIYLCLPQVSQAFTIGTVKINNAVSLYSCSDPCPITINWTTNPGASTVYINKNNAPSSAQGPNGSLPYTLSAGTYEFRMIADNYNTDGREELSWTVTVNVSPATTTPSPTSSTPTATPTPAPVNISSINITNLTSSSVTINWTTNALSDSTADYGTTSTYTNTVGSPNLVNGHSLVINGLSGNTTYHYRVKSRAGGYTATSGDQSFTTPSGGTGSSALPTPTRTPTPTPAGQSPLGGASPTSTTGGVLGASTSGATNPSALSESQTKAVSGASDTNFFQNLWDRLAPYLGSTPLGRLLTALGISGAVTLAAYVATRMLKKKRFNSSTAS